MLRLHNPFYLEYKVAICLDLNKVNKTVVLRLHNPFYLEYKVAICLDLNKVYKTVVLRLHNPFFGNIRVQWLLGFVSNGHTCTTQGQVGLAPLACLVLAAQW